MSCLKSVIEWRYITYDNESKAVCYDMCNDQSCIAYGTECLGKDKCHFYVENAFELSKEPKQPSEEHNAVKHPNYYCQGGIECIKAIEASMSPEGFQDYCKGNVMKYIWRWREKNGLEDLKKAQVYLGWIIESKEKQQ